MWRSSSAVGKPSFTYLLHLMFDLLLIDLRIRLDVHEAHAFTQPVTYHQMISRLPYQPLQLQTALLFPAVKIITDVHGGVEVGGG